VAVHVCLVKLCQLKQESMADISVVLRNYWMHRRTDWAVVLPLYRAQGCKSIM